MWKHHNENMIKLKNIYKSISKQTQTRLQEIFKILDLKYDNLYKIADKRTKEIINAKIDEWRQKNFLKGYFGVLANNIYNKIRVKNSEILELLIYGAYTEEQNKLDEYENQIIYDDMNYYYIQGQKEVNKSLPLYKRKEILTLTDVFFLSLLAMNDSSGYDFNTYKQIVIKNNTDKVYIQAIININQQKELDIDDIEFQNIIDRQLDSKLKINGEKIYGAIDHKLIELDNKAKIEGIKLLDKKAKVKFIAIEDNATTKMCKSLNNQIFNLHDWNEFYRYSKSNDRIVKYKCYGLIPGLNTPPIDDGFHFCRSTIEYVKSKNGFRDNNLNNVNSNKKEYGNSSILTDNIINICNELHEVSKQNGYENMVLIDSDTGKQKGKIATDKSVKEVGYSIEQQNIMQMSKNRSLIAVHNHPSNNTFSLTDIFKMIENRKVNGIIVTTDEFYYFLKAETEMLNIAKKNLNQFKEWLCNMIIKNSTVANPDNEMCNKIYKTIFDNLGWNYGRKRRI
ncbi:MAG: hypothetical protein ACI4ON_00385 [Clostridia bacterium]